MPIGKVARFYEAPKPPSPLPQTYGYSGGAVIGNFLWLAPMTREQLLVVDLRTDQRYSVAPIAMGVTFSNGVLTDGVFLYVIPADTLCMHFFDASSYVPNGSISWQSACTWPLGFSKTVSGTQFASALLVDTKLILMPSAHSTVITFNTVTRLMTRLDLNTIGGGVSSSCVFNGIGGSVVAAHALFAFPIGNCESIVLATSQFQYSLTSLTALGIACSSNCFAGVVSLAAQDQVYLIPLMYDAVVQLDALAVTAYHRGWPALVQAAVGTPLFMGGTYDGRSIWMVPSAVEALIRFDVATKLFTSYVSAYFENNVFSSIVVAFAHESLWMTPMLNDVVV